VQRGSQPVTFSSTGAKSKPVLDEGGFQQLLAAAYVLQQHNDSLRAKDPRLDAAWIFAQIAETETLVRHGNFDFSQAAKLVGERLCKMTGAVSVSVCLLKDDSAECVAETGVAAKKQGQSIAAASIAATERLKNGRQFQSLDAQADSRIDNELCRELGVRSLLAVPIQRSDETAGLIEIRWGLTDALHECDVRTCRLMTNLLAEMLGRENLSTAQPSQALVLAHKPEDADLPEHDETTSQPADLGDATESSGEQAEQDLASHCRVCGRAFSADEAFCGNCSLPRVAATTSSDGLQSKWASMWFMQQAQDTLQERRSVASKFLPPPVLKPSASIRLTPAATDERAESPYARWSTEYAAAKRDPLFTAERVTTEERVITEERAHLTGGPEPRILLDESPRESSSDYLSSILARLRPLLALRVRISRKTAVLGMFSMVAVLLLATWLSWATRSASQLTWFESLLVDLGLAEIQPRPAIVYAGSPNVRVWEDVHTALYYCPDSDLYGKTPGGRFTTQRAAQEDQFEPATRVACQ
jgi:ribosomal protein L37E